MKIIIFSIIAFIALSRAEPSYRVVGGQEAPLGLFPWQVVLYSHIDGIKMNCGGTLISNEWILTAAHCLKSATSYQVILGTTNVSDLDEGAIPLDIPLDHGFIHEEYKQLPDRSCIHDIALLRLPTAVSFTRNIGPLQLAPSNDYLEGGVNVMVSGWGQLYPSSPVISEKLMYADLMTITNNECRQYLPITAGQICATSPYSSASKGDSGGPLFTAARNGQLEHVGIVSYGIDERFPTAFTRTSSYIDYINRITGLNFP